MTGQTNILIALQKQLLLLQIKGIVQMKCYHYSPVLNLYDFLLWNTIEDILKWFQFLLLLWNVLRVLNSIGPH